MVVFHFFPITLLISSICHCIMVMKKISIVFSLFGFIFVTIFTPKVESQFFLNNNIFVNSSKETKVTDKTVEYHRLGPEPTIADHEGALFKLIRDEYPYSGFVAPLSKGRRPVPVEVTVEIKKFDGIDDHSESATFMGAVVLQWNDDWLTEIYESYRRTRNIHVDVEDQFLSADMIWAPILFFPSSTSQSQVWTIKERREQDLRITWPNSKSNYTSVIWKAFGYFTMRCELNLQLFPFDPEHTCDLVLMAPEGPKKVLFQTASSCNRSVLYLMGEDSKESNTFRLNKIDCINDTTPTGESSVGFNFYASRYQSFYVINLIVPCLLVTFLLLVGLLHPHCPDRPAFFLVILLSFWVIQDSITDILPHTAKRCGLQTCISFLSVLNCIYVVQSIFALRYMDGYDNPLHPIYSIDFGKDQKKPSQICQRKARRRMLRKIDMICLGFGVLITFCIPIVFFF